MKTVNIEKTRYRDNIGVTLRYVVFGMLSFIVIAVLLNASALKKDADLMKFGIRRNICLTIISPLSDLSSSMRLNMFREWLDNLTILKG